MAEGLDAKLEVESLARRTGIGWAVRFIQPHGHAKGRREAVEQVMKKIDGNVKADQLMWLRLSSWYPPYALRCIKTLKTCASGYPTTATIRAMRRRAG